MLRNSFIAHKHDNHMNAMSRNGDNERELLPFPSFLVLHGALSELPFTHTYMYKTNQI